MKSVSFAIITDGNVDQRIEEILDSISVNRVPDADIMVIGGESTSLAGVRHLDFDETLRPGWITRKKNLATQQARHEVIVYLHDYHVFDSEWYRAIDEFGWAWDLQMNAIRLATGRRTFDWLIHDHPVLPPHVLIPYGRNDLVRHQYISGGYWVAKKSFMQKEPLNENLLHHQAEDLEWSRRIRERYRIVMNPGAIVRHNKVHREIAMQGQRDALKERYAGFFDQ